jgi:hypothetical protein
MPQGAFVFTSKVDGQFQRAGFHDEQLVECHGSIHHLQCSRPCSEDIWPADAVQPAVDTENCLMRPPRLVVIEIGAGTDLPSVWRMCEAQDRPLVRINPREPEVPSARDIGIAAGALETLEGLRDVLRE